MFLLTLINNRNNRAEVTSGLCTKIKLRDPENYFPNWCIESFLLTLQILFRHFFSSSIRRLWTNCVCQLSYLCAALSLMVRKRPMAVPVRPTNTPETATCQSACRKCMNLCCARIRGVFICVISELNRNDQSD